MYMEQIIQPMLLQNSREDFFILDLQAETIQTSSFRKISAGASGDERCCNRIFQFRFNKSSNRGTGFCQGKAGAVTIAVTAEEESDLAKDADYVFMTPVRHTSEVSRWISSRISQIAFVDALCAAILESDREKFGKMLTQSASEFVEDIVH